MTFRVEIGSAPDPRRLDVFTHIQYLRGIAAMIVVYFHTKVYLPNFSWQFGRLFGYSGVDIFFAISGFIMMVATSRQTANMADFLLNRATRIYPIYWVATAAGLAMFALLPAYSSKESVDTTYVVASLLLVPIENEAGTSHGVPFLKIAWTLVLEVFFYAVFALTLLLANLTLRLIALVATMIGLAAYGYLAHPSSAAILFYTNPFVLEFALGCIAGYAVLKIDAPMPKLGGCLVLVICAAMLLAGGGRGDSFARVLWFGVPSACLVLVSALLEKSHGVLRHSPTLRLIGDASYSIYLFQSFCLVASRVAADKLHLPTQQPIVGHLGVAVAVLLSIAAGVLIHLWVERPCLRFARCAAQWVRQQLAATSAPRPPIARGRP